MASRASWRRTLGEAMWLKENPPDLPSQLEELFHQVWDSERRERMNDRIDQEARRNEHRSKRGEKRKS